MTAAPTDPAAPAGRRGDIQGLRALAVLLVVVYHAGGVLHGGYIGVDVFFVVSGYVIARMIVGEMETTGRLDLWRFYLRRIRRLLPAPAAGAGTRAGRHGGCAPDPDRSRGARLRGRR